MGNKIYIVDDGMDFRAFREDVIQKAAIFEVAEVCCPACGRYTFRFPIVVRKSDLERMEHILQSIYYVIDKYGLKDLMMQDVLMKIIDAVARTREKTPIDMALEALEDFKIEKLKDKQ